MLDELGTNHEHSPILAREGRLPEDVLKVERGAASAAVGS
jgi:hypothetical protein